MGLREYVQNSDNAQPPSRSEFWSLPNDVIRDVLDTHREISAAKASQYIFEEFGLSISNDAIIKVRQRYAKTNTGRARADAYMEAR